MNCANINHVLSPAECPELCSECNSADSYCDCGNGACKKKSGFTETLDLCSAARCGEHGTCSATFLGGELPVTDIACVCDDGWSGPTCDINPCIAQNKSCGDHGTCVALSDNDAHCDCELGYSGESCETSCDEVCVGSYPYNCNQNIAGVVKYGCKSGGGCSYLQSSVEDFGSNWCTFKEVVSTADCTCGSENDCELTVLCNADGTCPTPSYLVDQAPCNSVPFGVCINGTCMPEGSTSAPTTKSTTGNPTSNPETSSPSKAPTMPPSDIAAPCEGVCQGEYPFGCNPNLGSHIVKYGCKYSGGCTYLSAGNEYPSRILIPS